MNSLTVAANDGILNRSIDEERHLIILYVTQGPDVAKFCEPFRCVVALENPLPVDLNLCQWLIEAPGMEPSRQIIEQR